jgi:hypothetical protein
LHGRFSLDLVLVGVRQQGQEASALDGGVELALIDRTCTCQASGDDLAVFGNEVTQCVDVTVKRQKRLRLNNKDWVLRLGRLFLSNFLNVAMRASYAIC